MKKSISTLVLALALALPVGTAAQDAPTVEAVLAAASCHWASRGWA